jgi:DNA invertase Pin-like site-specific DNA recombinase
MTIRMYERVSSKQQQFESQRGDLEAFARSEEAKGTEVVWYRDKFTGKTTNRPDFTRLMKEARAGDTIVVHRLDRLGRSVRELVNLFADLQERRIGFQSLRDSFNLDTASGRLMLNMLISIAQFETEVRAERIASAIATRRAQGKAWTGGRPKGSCHRLTPELRQIVLGLKAEGKAVVAIAKSLKLARSSVYTILSEAS